MRAPFNQGVAKMKIPGIRVILVGCILAASFGGAWIHGVSDVSAQVEGSGNVASPSSLLSSGEEATRSRAILPMSTVFFDEIDRNLGRISLHLAGFNSSSDDFVERLHTIEAGEAMDVHTIMRSGSPARAEILILDQFNPANPLPLRVRYLSVTESLAETQTFQMVPPLRLRKGDGIYMAINPTPDSESNSGIIAFYGIPLEGGSGAVNDMLRIE
jgi:hypothetical protein